MTPARSHARAPLARRRALALWITCGLTAIAAAACERPLLAPSDERSPFDRYDAVRNQYASQYITDDRGVRHPNLRERLAPKR